MIYSMSNFLRSTRSVCSLLCLGAGLSLTQMAAAQDDVTGPYVTVGGAFLSADLDLSNLDVQGNNLNLGEESANIFMLNGRAGYRVHKFFALEAEGGLGLGGDSLQQNVPVPVDGFGTVNVDLNADIDISNYFVGMGRAILPVSEQFDIFIRGGYGTARGEVDAVATTALLAGASVSGRETDSINGFAYGIGAEFRLDKNSGIRLDASAINSDVQFISAAYSYRF